MEAGGYAFLGATLNAVCANLLDRKFFWGFEDIVFSDSSRRTQLKRLDKPNNEIVQLPRTIQRNITAGWSRVGDMDTRHERWIYTASIRELLPHWMSFCWIPQDSSRDRSVLVRAVFGDKELKQVRSKWSLVVDWGDITLRSEEFVCKPRSGPPRHRLKALETVLKSLAYAYLERGLHLVEWELRANIERSAHPDAIRWIGQHFQRPGDRALMISLLNHPSDRVRFTAACFAGPAGITVLFRTALNGKSPRVMRLQAVRCLAREKQFDALLKISQRSSIGLEEELLKAFSKCPEPPEELEPLVVQWLKEGSASVAEKAAGLLSRIGSSTKALPALQARLDEGAGYRLSRIILTAMSEIQKRWGSDGVGILAIVDLREDTSGTLSVTDEALNPLLTNDLKEL